jgi:microcystin-dependent protein
VAEPYVGEIRIFGGTFPPVNWAFCNGQLLPISEYETLFTLLGTTYGGDGETTFALPNLISRMPVGAGPNSVIGALAGTESVALTTANLPAHTHAARANDTAATSTSPAGNVWAAWGDSPYTTDSAHAAMDVAGVAAVGQGLPHNNRAPYLGLSFIIAFSGIFPSPS